MNSIAGFPESREVNSYLHEGSELFAEGQIEAAKKVYLEALKVISDSAEIYQKLGQSSLELQQWQDATIYYQEAIKLDPYNYWNYYDLGKALVAQNRFEEAVTYYQQATTIEPEQSFAYRQLGAVFIEIDRWQEAVVVLEKAIALDPNDCWVYYDLGKAYARLGSWQPALSSYQQFTNREPNFWEGYFRLGEVFEQLQDLNSAITAYQKSNELNPEFAWNYYHLGNIYRGNKDYEKAETHYQKLIELEPNFWQTYHQLGEIALRLQKWNSAADYFEQAIGFNPNFFNSYYKLGISLAKLDRFSAAKASWAKAIELNPAHAKTYVQLIDLSMNKQKVTEAREWLALAFNNCQEGLELLKEREQQLFPTRNSRVAFEPQSVKPEDRLNEATKEFKRGKALARKEQWQLAVEALQHAAALNHRDPWIHCELGLCFDKLQQYNLAEQSFYSALQYIPDSSWLHCCLGAVFYAQKKWQLAADTYTTAAALEPDNFWHYHKLGDARYYLGQLEAAAEAYSRASEFHPDDASISYRLARTLISLQRHHEAKTALEKAIAIAPDMINYHELLVDLLQNCGTDQELQQAQTTKALYQRVVDSRKAIRLDKRNFEAHKNLADASIKLEVWDEAAIAYNYALKLNLEARELYPNLAIALHKQHKWQLAAEAYDKAIEIDSSQFWLYSGLAEVCDNLGQWQKAATAYGKAIKLKPDDCWLHSSLGEILVKQHLWLPAINSYNQALALKPENPWLWTCLAAIHHETENWQAAKDAYEQAQKLNSENFWEYEKLGDCLFNLGHWQEAVNCYQKVFDRCEHLSWYHKLSYVGWSYHNLGDRLRQENKWQEAEQAYRSAIELNGDLPWHYFYLAEALERQYKSVEALTAYRRAAELNSLSTCYKQEPNLVLQQMKNRGLVICIYTCAKYQNQQQAIRDTWLKEVIKYNIPYYFVIGKPGAQSYVDGDILYVDAPDTYEHLPHKTYKFIEYIYSNTFYSHLLKVDDDCYVNVENLLKSGFEQYDYMGKVAGHEDDLDRNWHVGKTADASIGEYQGVHKGSWANGASGYFLNRYAMEKLLAYDNYEEIALELYEDKLVSDLLRPAGIIPYWSPKYLVGVERNDQYTDYRLGLVPWDETPFPQKGNDVVVFHSDAAPEITYEIASRFNLDATQNRQFLRSANWWRGYPHNNICLDRVDEKEIKLGIEDILGFFVVRNEALRLPYALDYYRSLGVKWFFVVDNHSNDGTSEYLASQPDVFLWHTTRPYRDSRWGVDWVEILLKNYGTNHWCVLVDADELLYYPGCETKKLTELCQDLEKEEKQAMSTILLDMYSRQPIKDAVYTPGQNFLEVCSYFDRDFFSLKEQDAGPFSNQTGYWGGLRQRIFDNCETAGGKRLYCLNKVPLIKYDYSIKLKEGFHWIGNINISQQTGCLLHFKYFSTFHEKAKEEVARGQHWNGASEYAQYAQQLDEEPSLSFYDPECSVKLVNSQQLLELSIIKSYSAKNSEIEI